MVLLVGDVGVPLESRLVGLEAGRVPRTRSIWSRK